MRKSIGLYYSVLSLCFMKEKKQTKHFFSFCFVCFVYASDFILFINDQQILRVYFVSIFKWYLFLFHFILTQNVFSLKTSHDDIL